ncbi:hypothetical protein BGP78_09770 [Pseudoalteromonas sp. MSK9-3]|uniref:class I adenylate-forming enzyme family protein n=1 Tax=Pseudoalteromonas sp. MSK9-3 TaxID=1897633 RepID=UPI000E6CD1AD|nr:fatty acid--CoA ligase family protein [Pseudoalteromonas sp. MSK9-3]RJE77179.1 hypothetical protein BGP78_09770 [Pseudoalteromonas sp. MSK9-3]
MNIQTLIEKFVKAGNAPAIVSDDLTWSYSELVKRVNIQRNLLNKDGIENSVVLLCADYGHESLALLIALWQNNNIVALHKNKSPESLEKLAKVTGAKLALAPFSDGTHFKVECQFNQRQPEIVHSLLGKAEPGIVIFSSGTAGEPKGVLHALNPLLAKYGNTRSCGKLLAFLLFDHMGGIVTVLHALSTQGTLVLPKERTPREVCRCIERFQVETLHLSPTMLNLVVNTDSFKARDFSSLQHIDFGSEPMSQTLLTRLQKAFGSVSFCHTYGMSEFGLLMGDPDHPDQTGVKVDPEYKLRVVDGILHIQGPTLMQGYINQEAEFTNDGYLITQDTAELKDGFLKITGRRSDIINVGGKSVIPSLVEKKMLEIDNIADVSVYGETNPILGQIVAACCYLHEPEVVDEVKQRVFGCLKGHLSAEQIPRLITISDSPLVTERFKKAKSPEKIAHI